MVAGRPLVLGSRGSALALAQVELLRAALAQAWPGLSTEVRIFITRGDRKLDLSLLRASEAGGKGLFTRELEEALLAREIDVAVHSLKDLPGHLPAGLALAAVLPRAATADVLISKAGGGLAGQPRGAALGTSSIRRARQLQWLRPDLRVLEWRGNVQTRLRKLAAQPEVTGIVLAQAGLDRLGFATAGGELLFEEARFHVASLGSELLPAIGQGAIALEIAEAREEMRTLLQAVDHRETHLAIRAERELQRLLAGDCTLPVGVRTRLAGEELLMESILFESERVQPRRAEARGGAEAPEEVARQLLGRLLG